MKETSTTAARRLATKSSACLRMVAKPFSAIYSLSLLYLSLVAKIWLFFESCKFLAIKKM